MAVHGEPPRSGGSVLAEWTDTELVERLRRSGFAGNEWRAAEAVLVAVAISVLHDMLLGGSVARKSLALHRAIILTPEETERLREQPEDRTDLVHAAVVEGIRVFRRLCLEGEGWDPERGASLLSYVVNGCVLALANPVRAWRTQRRRTPRTEVLDEDHADRLSSSEPDPLARVLADEDRAALLGSMPAPLTRAVWLWIDTGWPWIRIAGEIGVSPRSLEGLLRRWRQQHVQQKEEES